jgi:hypothetical protein
MQAGWADHTYSYPLWQYQHTIYSAPTLLATLDFGTGSLLPPDLTSTRGVDDASAWSAFVEVQLAPPPSTCGSDTLPNAVLVWLDYHLTDEASGPVVSTRHSPYNRMTVRFIKPNDIKLAESHGGMSSKVKVRLYLDEFRGLLDVAVDL